MSVLTPNMSLIQSTIGVDTGLSWEQNLNSDLNILDGHNHTPGSGVQITPGAININSDLSFNNHNGTLFRSVRFNPQASPLSPVSPDLGCLFEAGSDLYYNDGVGNQIRMTQSGAIAGSPGSITGLVSPASVTYIPINKTFVFQSDVNTPASLDAGSVILRDLTANSHGITLSPPNALAADYSITYPAGTPEKNSVMNVSLTGTSVWESSYDAIVGTSAQVADGSATHTTLTSAMAAVSANGSILVLQGAWTENLTISKTLNIYGSGTNSFFTGTLSFVGVSFAYLKGIRWSGPLSFDSGSSGNTIEYCFMSANQSALDSGNGNFVDYIFQG